MNERRSRDQTIYGIPCSVKSAKVREAVRLVLAQIRRTAPEDFERIQLRLREFASIDRWRIKERPHPWAILRREEEPRFRFVQNKGFDSPGIIELPRCRHSIGVIAHELGHVATRERDLAGHPHELGPKVIEEAANFYACKWGFRRNIGLLRCRGYFVVREKGNLDAVAWIHEALKALERRQT